MKRYRTWVEVDARALTSNIENLRSRLRQGTRFCAVVKANAYGHGLLETVRIAARAGVDAFAVDHIDDALRIRNEMPSALIVVLGYTMRDRYLEAVQNDIHLTLYDLNGLRELNTVATETAHIASVHVKIETGTSRQGVLPEQLDHFLRECKTFDHVDIAGVSTHFANVEEASDSSYAATQIKRFQEAVETVRANEFEPEFIHCACSAAIILYPETHFTMVRAGIALYGIWPSTSTESTARKHEIPCELTPVLRWKTRIAQVKSLPAGTPIGYGLTETLQQNGRIAILPVGYWDGYDRKLSSRGRVLINGEACRVLGRVCMNMIIVDVSSIANVEPEDEVIILGTGGRHSIHAKDIGELTDTIAYEVVARINPTLPRVVIS